MTELYDLIATRGSKFYGVERLDNVLRAMISMADAHEAMRSHARSVAANATLTAIGKREAVRKNLADVDVKHLSSATKAVAKLREDMADWENRLVPPRAEK